MRKFKKVAMLSMAVMMSTTAFVGCGVGNNSIVGGTTGEKGQITVQVANLGYGIKWLNDLASVFNSLY